jgi:hypothetical protein
MADVLINHPYFGSMWLSNCYIEDGLVVGDFWDDSDVGDWSLPDDYNGEWQTFNFPVSCIRKDPCNLRGLPPHLPPPCARTAGGGGPARSCQAG